MRKQRKKKVFVSKKSSSFERFYAFGTASPSESTSLHLFLYVKYIYVNSSRGNTNCTYCMVSVNLFMSCRIYIRIIWLVCRYISNCSYLMPHESREDRVRINILFLLAIIKNDIFLLFVFSILSFQWSEKLFISVSKSRKV